MIKNTKKIFAIMLTVIMVMAMSVNAFAAKITINSGAKEGEVDNTEYTYYEIFKADIRANTDTVAYYIPAESSTLANAVKKTGLFTVTLSADGSRYNVVLKDNPSGSDIAAALDIDSIKNSALATATFSQSNGTAVADNLDAGYYLIKSSLGTALAVQTLNEVTITEKNEYPGIPGGKTDDVADDTVSIGQTVTYTIPVSIPVNVASKDITVVDIITKGLTMNTAITVTGSAGDNLTSLTWVEDTSYAADPAGSSKKYTVTIPANTVAANAGQTLVLTYTAQVNSNAVVNTPETNKAHLEYDHFTGVESQTTVKTHAFTLKKIDGEKVTDNMPNEEKFALEALDGAEFTLWTAETGGTQIFVTEENGVYRADITATSGSNIKAGEATIEGLKSGTYYLQEVVAPTGYNLLTKRVEITVGEKTSAQGVDIAVENNAGTELPSTGGIGTTIFYVIGAILVLGAGVVLITRRRMSAK